MAHVLTDLHQIIMYPYRLNNDELQEMYGIRDKALSQTAVRSTNQLLKAALQDEGAQSKRKIGGTSTVTERQLVLQSLGQL